MNALIVRSFATLSNDNRITVWHIGMYSAFIQLWHSGGCQNPVAITRRKVLALSRIGNIVTYHKCIKELESFGYIDYKPSYNPYKGSTVYLKTI